MTALDLFIILCFIAVFAALVEFALINFLDILVKKRREREAEKEKELQAKEDTKAKLVQTVALGVVPIADATATVEQKPSDRAKADEKLIIVVGVEEDGDNHDLTKSRRSYNDLFHICSDEKAMKRAERAGDDEDDEYQDVDEDDAVDGNKVLNFLYQQVSQ